jgi:hypothetical protein
VRDDYTSQIITTADELGHAAILLQILLSSHDVSIAQKKHLENFWKFLS